MSTTPPTLLFKATSGGTFSYPDGYDNVSNQDLVDLYRLTQKALLSLETEIDKRSITVGIGVEKAIRRVKEIYKEVRITKRIPDRAERLVHNAISAVTDPVFTEPGARRYQIFFTDILSLKNHGIFVLCAASLGKEKVRNMKKEDRMEFLDYLGNNFSTFNSSALDDLATKFDIPKHDKYSEPNQRKRRLSQVLETSPRKEQQNVLQGKGTIEGGGDSEVAAASTSMETEQMLRRQRQIEYSYSNAPVKSISPLGEKLTDAIRSSKQWQWERAVGQNEVTGCITALAPKDRNIDISLNMLVGFEMGNKLIEELRLIPI
ncbi:hypothetical protein BDV37DRAFT_282192 [Aspergillus pseudonomiae]|uniref:Uncharacterized protein n=1 Tax=Aspergillus pseudonomiae TaxID=1506151 RepID=A0A5N7DF91_9EURO|nr:uncharacterized protein BDV37DRAFT_282192 [Aspergillus pseudonomiae]KAE8404949.1 hypothetical protein BDV37DRAFT_282192 [Aspergillus pseudonomiae]